MRFAFLHGGPGFNSFAEQAMLGPRFGSGGHEISFWNEPSALRPDGEPFVPGGAFERWLDSAEQFVSRAASGAPVHLIAHSFTAQAAMNIARLKPGWLASLVLVTPAADPFVTYCNVLRLAHEDLERSKPGVASTIAGCLERSRAVLDAEMREGMMNVLQDDRLFTHYWADAEQMAASMAARARPEAQFDLDSFFAVLADFGERGASLLSTAPISVRALVLFGAHDRITRVSEQQRAVRAAMPEARIEVMDGCSHYLHLDQPGRFFGTVVNWAAAASAGPS
jgi:pimeloyl-ACP methyl ester carboxylesterase